MSRITTGWLKPNHRKLSFLTMLYCLDCGHLFESSRIGRACPKCGYSATIPAARWSPEVLELGKSKKEKEEI